MSRALMVLALLGCGGGAGGGGGEPSPEPPTDPAAAVDPGTKTLHRLNGTEYDNTVQDLLHTRLQPAALLFPDDPSSYGFDNQADALTISPVQAELYERAADLLVDDLFRVRDEQTELVTLGHDSAGLVPVGGLYTDSGWRFVEEGSLSATLPIDDDGVFALRVVASGLSEGAPPLLAIEVDGVVEAEVEVGEVDAAYGVELWRIPGDVTLTARFLNPDGEEGRAVVIRALELEGPLDPETGVRDGYHDVVPCDPDLVGDTACATTTLTGLATRAWRRPLTEADETWLMDAYVEARGAGLGWTDAVAHALKVILMSPDFLFRIEADPEPGQVRQLSDHELASRLSYMLWSTMPDAALLAEADRGDLSRPDVLGWHVERMLDDPRSEALVDGFASQWLSVEALEGLDPDPELFPEFDDALRASMAEELQRIARDHVLGDRPLLEMLVTQETWIDQRLAEHYGLPFDPEGEPWQAVDLSGTSRSGLLTTAGMLSLSSHPDRTSVVRRGKLVLSSLLCSEPPPPPPGVEGLEDVDPETYSSVREQLEAHREDPTCNSCHQEMDPIGFALQPFDAIGLQRAVDEMGAPIDATASLPDGTELRGPSSVGAWATTDPRWPTCVAEKVFTWGVGRVPTAADAPVLDQMVADLTAGDGRFETLVEALVVSAPFQQKASSEEVP